MPHRKQHINVNSETSGPLRRLLAVSAAGLAGAVALTGCSLLSGSTDDSTDGNDVSEEQFDAAADASAGDCLPFEILGTDQDTFAIDCGGEDAFWSITEIVADPGITTAGGTITDDQQIFDVCGEEIGAFLPGKPWTEWNMIYDQGTGEVDYLFCVEALDKPDADEKTPAVPEAGECISSADTAWYTLPCEAALADTTVTHTVAFDTADWAAPDVETAVAECAGVYYELTDQFNRVNGVVCTD
ncbi:hypothetical protein [Glycomyces sp. NRRL B-16210]|uniref:hypothetical protein n=1 Tax=Glycomyces sp. NRRL B-16210 TaxID=1463821 RepID=UPI0004C17DB5|nr:hypothetical protein [Glycomyces sp. NRRL B-16210]